MKKLKKISLLFLSATFMNFSFAQTEVTDEDLEKFVEVYKEVQVENQKLQQGMAQTIQEKGMDVNRFNEIYQASSTPDQEVEATPEELKLHKEIVEEIEGAQADFQAEVSTLIEDAGMTLEDYQNVFAELQSDQELQQKFSELMQKGQQPAQQPQN